MEAVGRPYLDRGAEARRPRSVPMVVSAPAVLVGLAMMLPLVYLVVRSTGATGEAWDLLLSFRTAQTMGRTVLLMVTVTAASAAIALPLAWLTVRTDLPLRRVWSVVDRAAAGGAELHRRLPLHLGLRAQGYAAAASGRPPGD